MFPTLTRIAKRVHGIPATSAPSERLFSSAGLIVTEKRSRLSASHVEDLVFLRNSWEAVEKIKSYEAVDCT